MLVARFGGVVEVMAVVMARDDLATGSGIGGKGN
jgi:hypothetical protein